MIRLFRDIKEIKIKIDDCGPSLDLIKATLKCNFGPWKEGHRFHIARMHYTAQELQEIDENGNIVNKQLVLIMTSEAINKLSAIIQWMDNDDEMDHLYTKDGKKVYRFYEGTHIETFLRSLYKEIEAVK